MTAQETHAPTRKARRTWIWIALAMVYGAGVASFALRDTQHRPAGQRAMQVHTQQATDSGPPSTGEGHHAAAPSQVVDPIVEASAAKVPSGAEHDTAFDAERALLDLAQRAGRPLGEGDAGMGYLPIAQPSPVVAAGMQRKQRERLQRRMDAEGRDPQWSDNAETSLRAHMDGIGMGRWVRRIECATETCRVELQPGADEKMVPTGEMLASVAPLLRGGTVITAGEEAGAMQAFLPREAVEAVADLARRQAAGAEEAPL